MKKETKKEDLKRFREFYKWCIKRGYNDTAERTYETIKTLVKETN